MMAASMMLSMLFLLGIAVSANADSCPPSEEMEPCICESMEFADKVVVTCMNVDNDVQAEDLINPMKNLVGKKNVVLEIKNFDLTKIPSNFLQGIDVVTLGVTNCDVSSLTLEDQGFLAGLEDSLVELKIRESITKDNDLSKLRFAPYRKLKELEFYFNSIPKVYAGWFEDSTLEVVRIIYNDVQIIEDGAFASLDNLRRFELRGEKEVGAIKRSALPDPANKLKKIELDYDNIANLEEDTFSNMPELKEVWLMGNEITTLDQNTWKPVWEQLGYIFVWENPIQCDSNLAWTFGLRGPTIRGTCKGPESVKGTDIQEFIKAGSQELEVNGLEKELDEQPNLEDLDDQPNIKGLDDQPNLEDLDDQPNIKDLDDQPNLKDLDDQPNIKDLDDQPSPVDLDDQQNFEDTDYAY